MAGAEGWPVLKAMPLGPHNRAKPGQAVAGRVRRLMADEAVVRAASAAREIAQRRLTR